MWVMDERRGDGRTDGRTEGRNIYRRVERLGLSLWAVPSLDGTVVTFYLGGGREHGKGLRRISREVRVRKECRKTER